MLSNHVCCVQYRKNKIIKSSLLPLLLFKPGRFSFSVTQLVQNEPFKHFWIRHKKDLGKAPNAEGKDWVILVKRKDGFQ